MAKRATSPDKLTIKGLSQDDQAWLKTESDRLGCDPENLVRMMIRQRAAAIVVGYPPTDPGPPPGYQEPRYFDDRKHAFASERAREIYTPPPTINEADSELDAVMSAPPSLPDEAAEVPDALFDAAPAIVARPRPAASLTPYNPVAEQLTGRGTRHQRQLMRGTSNITPYPRGGFDAFTETEFVAINHNAIGSNSMGDGVNNVKRDNLRHFGVAGTRGR